MKMICFDLDGTLAESKQPLSEEMGKLLSRITSNYYLAIISGADWPQMQTQVLPVLTKYCSNLSKVILCPTCAAKTYKFSEEGAWEQLYSLTLSESQKNLIVSTLNSAIEAEGLTFPTLWGEQIEDRGSQITFSALGQKAPLSEKAAWDPDFSKRQAIKARIDSVLSDFSVRLGGSTSIDITLKGIDKSFGIRKLTELCDIKESEILFFGDALFPGGNDFAVRSTGASCVSVKDPYETMEKLSKLQLSGEEIPQ